MRRLRHTAPLVLALATAALSSCQPRPDARPPVGPPTSVVAAPVDAQPRPPLQGTLAASDGKPDLTVVHRIKDEAYHRGPVMSHLFWLTDVNGPRLTGSPGWNSAADWVVRTLASWGVANPHLEPWGRFGRSWQLQRFEAALVEPAYARLTGFPRPWSRGTSSEGVTAGLVLAPLFPEVEDRDDALDLAKYAARIARYAQTYRGKLHGKIVLTDPPRDLALPKEPKPLWLEDKRLSDIAEAPEHLVPEPWTWPLKKLPRDDKKRSAVYANLPLEVQADFWDRRNTVRSEFWRFLASEGVAGVLSTDDRGDGSIVFVESTGEWDAARPMPPPAIVLAPEDYDRLVDLTEKGVAARVRLQEVVQASDQDVDAYNVVGEIPGTGSKRDELVILGAHLDSWYAGTGATDDGAGCAVMMEAMRILKTLNLPMDRTVRVVLWSGEEQGLYGSRAYVKRHFGDPVTMAILPEHAKVAVYLNFDGGTGRIRGVNLQENDAARPVFESLLAPFKDEGATTLTIKNSGGTDHLSFDAIGLPGFQFIQDPLDYGARTHHSSLDVYQHAQASDLEQAAAVVASLAYHAANRPEMFPRKPLPAPLPPKVP